MLMTFAISSDESPTRRQTANTAVKLRIDCVDDFMPACANFAGRNISAYSVLKLF